MAKPLTIKGVPQPERLRVPLFPHQRANIYRMETLERDKFSILPGGDRLEGAIGILGDPPGTGKTLTILGLICRDRMKCEGLIAENTIQTCSNIDGSLRITRKVIFSRIKTTLIVTPLSIFHQWEKEIQSSDLTYKMIKQRSDINELEDYEVAICTINMYNSVAERYANVSFKRFVYDEMDSAYIANMAQVNACFTWFVSATFDSVLGEINRSRKIHYMKRMFMNILSDFYSRESLLNSITITSTEKLRNLRPVPMNFESKYYAVRRAPVVVALRHHMDMDLVGMIDAGNIKDAIKHLGGTENDSNIADLLRSRAAQKVREAEMKVQEYKGRQREEWVGRLEVATRALREIESKITDIEMGTCGVCSENMRYPTLIECCQQIACARCIASWFKTNTTCPFCRKMNPKITHLRAYSGDESEGEVKTIVATTDDKLVNLIRIAQQGAKILVFASHSNQFGEVSHALRLSGITFACLTGQAGHRQAVLDSYIKGDVKVLILNSRMNGAGLNLQITTDIILWHAMEKALTKQLIGRALRYGLDHHLIVHKFFSEREEEEIQ